MLDFYLASWKPYKGLLAAFALVAPIAYCSAWGSLVINTSEQGYLALIVLRWSIPWFIGWFLILLGDGACGGTFPVRLRSYYVLLGILMLALPAIRGWVYYDRDSISSRHLVESLPESTREVLRRHLDTGFAIGTIPHGKEYDFYSMLQAVRLELSPEQKVRRVEFISGDSATLWLSSADAGHAEPEAHMKKLAGHWAIDTITYR